MAHVTIADFYQLYLQYPSVQTDTRKLKPGDIFFALSGPNFNGNDYALKAIEAGASYAVVDEDIENATEQILRVDNVLETLQLLSKHHREQFQIPFIAITGSNGKTTTKELVSTVLSAQYKTYTTEGNLNNHIGIPITLLRVKADAEMAVIEMGANHQKEIAGYCTYVEPDYGIITNCGKAHLEGFGGEEGVRKGKGELFDYLRENNGAIFRFEDYEYLHEMSAGITNVIGYGTNSGIVQGTALAGDSFLKVHLHNEDRTINTQLVGDYNLPNVLCAVAVGKHFNISIDKIIAALENYQPDNSRSQMVIKGSNHIILDAYNANPSSMKVAIENIANTPVQSKIVMLGGMMELGAESLQEHAAVINHLEKYNWQKVILVGGDFKDLTHSFEYFDSSADASQWVKEQNFKNSHILIKGSRSIKMEVIADSL